jgi:hypothetical protein
MAGHSTKPSQLIRFLWFDFMTNRGRTLGSIQRTTVLNISRNVTRQRQPRTLAW